jgi:hypothetical protein
VASVGKAAYEAVVSAAVVAVSKVSLHAEIVLAGKELVALLDELAAELAALLLDDAVLELAEDAVDEALELEAL